MANKCTVKPQPGTFTYSAWIVPWRTVLVGGVSSLSAVGSQLVIPAQLTFGAERWSEQSEWVKQPCGFAGLSKEHFGHFFLPLTQLCHQDKLTAFCTVVRSKSLWACTRCPTSSCPAMETAGYHSNSSTNHLICGVSSLTQWDEPCKPCLFGHPWSTIFMN